MNTKPTKYQVENRGVSQSEVALLIFLVVFALHGFWSLLPSSSDCQNHSSTGTKVSRMGHLSPFCPTKIVVTEKDPLLTHSGSSVWDLQPIRVTKGTEG